MTEKDKVKEEKIVTVRRDSYKRTFDVRVKVNEDRVLYFAQLYDAGEDVPPLVLGRLQTEDELHLVDGRNRDGALGFLEREEADCVIRTYETFGDMVADAVRANWGGPLPETEDDLKHTVRMLTGHGLGRKKIYDTFPFIPREMMRKLFNQVQTEIKNSKMRQAVAAVAEGNLSAKDAAEKYDVELPELRQKLKGKDKDHGESKAAEIKANISKRFRGVSTALGKQLTTALQMCEGNEITNAEFEAAIKQSRGLIARLSANVDSHQKQYETMTGKPMTGPKRGRRKTGKNTGDAALNKMGLEA